MKTPKVLNVRLGWTEHKPGMADKEIRTLNALAHVKVAPMGTHGVIHKRRGVALPVKG